MYDETSETVLLGRPSARTPQRYSIYSLTRFGPLPQKPGGKILRLQGLHGEIDLLRVCKAREDKSGSKRLAAAKPGWEGISAEMLAVMQQQRSRKCNSFVHVEKRLIESAGCAAMKHSSFTRRQVRELYSDPYPGTWGRQAILDLRSNRAFATLKFKCPTFVLVPLLLHSLRL